MSPCPVHLPSHLRVLLAGALVAATIGLIPTARAATTPSAACGSGWNVVSSQNPKDIHNFFNGVTAIAPDDVWAVGGRYDGTRRRPLIEHWDGAAWTIIPSPRVGRFSSLNAVSAVSSNDVWAVGTAPHERVLIEHWDGSAWTIVPAPFKGELSDVEAISDVRVLAVGTDFSDRRLKPLALRWTGSGWLQVHAEAGGSPSPTTFDSVSAATETDAWAVGVAEDNGTAFTLAQRWDGDRFSTVRTPTPGRRGHPRLLGVDAMGSDDVWAVGEFLKLTSVPAAHTVAAHWDGSSWSIVPSPNRRFSGYDEYDNSLQGVDAVSPTDVWAVGYSQGVNSDFTTSRSRTLTLKWNGTEWSIVPSPNAFDIRHSVLRDVSALADGHVWAVGAAYDSRAEVERPLVLARC